MNRPLDFDRLACGRPGFPPGRLAAILNIGHQPV
jgi:hypothetical protein